MVHIINPILPGDDDPDINENELKEIARLLLRHALATHQLSLTAEIISRYHSLTGLTISYIMCVVVMA